MFGGIIAACEGSEHLLDFSVSKIPSDTFIFFPKIFFMRRMAGRILNNLPSGILVLH